MRRAFCHLILFFGFSKLTSWLPFGHCILPVDPHLKQRDVTSQHTLARVPAGCNCNPAAKNPTPPPPAHRRPSPPPFQSPAHLPRMATQSVPSADPRTDPFSKHFTGPFQGIPTRVLPSDTLAFTAHLLAPHASATALTSLRDTILSIAHAWTHSYIWQRTSAFDISLSASGTYLSGTLEYGDAIDDEWLAVSILLEAARKAPHAWIRVCDSDGEFLLIEAAHALPRWLNPDVAAHRVWLHQGRLLIIPPAAKKTAKKEISLDEALKFLAGCDPESLVRDKRVETEALARTREYPAAAERHAHRARIVVPRKIAGVLHSSPGSIAAAVEAFYVRDPVSLRALQKSPATTRFPWRDTVEISARFTKVLFAQLKGQVWLPPYEAKFPMTEEGRTDVGVKVTAGFEMLLAEASEVLLTSETRRTLVREIRAMIDSGYAGPTDAEIATWSNEEDGEDWLQIDFTEFEKGLKGAPAAGGWGGDADQEGKLKRMVERFEEFLNDDKAGPDGVTFSDDEELNSDDDISDEDDEVVGEDKSVSFNEDEFERMMRDMMGLPPPSADAEEEAAIRRAQDQIEKELTEAGAISRDTVPKIQEIKEDDNDHDSEDDYDDNEKEVVDIDYTLAKNLLESFKGQGGLSGPAGTLLARMGMMLPRDEPEAEVEGKGKEVVR
ncbi:SGT1 protein-domain-containing protein [Tricharina praecox]|uniref:SGT1 protein-domain-containing protein n=1 Tax=Tricharina praecox TaxID=43433 RepID=UPI002220595B|nr:SGT1 protein-domain-containing protein [Tricharina praecox]KAI5853583.1 SGT1 protein-domain-containing protein [Tricharina praecox]